MKLKHLQSALESVSVFDSPRIELEQYPTPPALTASIADLIDRKYDDIRGRSVGDLGVGCGILSIACALLGAAYQVGFDIDDSAIDTARANFAEFELTTIDLVKVDISSMRYCHHGDAVESEERESLPKDEVPARVKSHPVRGRGRGGRLSKRGGRAPGKQSNARSTKRQQLRDSEDASDEDDNDSDSEEERADDRPSPPPAPSLLPLADSHPAVFPPSLLDTVITNPPFGTRNAGIDVTFVHVALQLARRAVYSFHKTSTRAYLSKLGAQWDVKCEVIAEMKFTLASSYKFHKQKAVDVDVDLWRWSFGDKQKPARFVR